MKIKINPCPHCGSAGKKQMVCRVILSGSIFDRHLYYIECPECHWCGKTKILKYRAIKAWNRQRRHT